MAREDHPVYQTHLDHGARWGPASSATGDHRHWYFVDGPGWSCEGAWTDSELNHPVAVIEALERIGR